MYFKKKYLLFSLIIFLAIISFFFINIGKIEKEKRIASEPILLNLLTSVHPNLDWSFKPTKPKIFVRPGDVITIEYIVENLGDKEKTGIATFAYFPRQIGNYISKINCFCYDAQTLQPKEKDKFVLVILVDPELLRDKKTKSVKEATIQFTFFDYKEYKMKKESS